MDLSGKPYIKIQIENEKIMISLKLNLFLNKLIIKILKTLKKIIIADIRISIPPSEASSK